LAAAGFIVERHDRRVVPHEGDLLSESRGSPNQPQSSPAWEMTPAQRRMERWIEAEINVH
jgi:hypothetical protein